MSKKTKTQATASGTEQAVVDNRIGVMVPNGTPERIRSLERTPMFWRGALRGKDNTQVQVRAECRTRQGSLRIVTTANSAVVGSLSKVGNHYEGTLGQDTKVRAWFQQAGEPRDKAGLRIVIGIDDGSYTREAKQEAAVDLDAELKKLDAVVQEPEDESNVPF